MNGWETRFFRSTSQSGKAEAFSALQYLFRGGQGKTWKGSECPGQWSGSETDDLSKKPDNHPTSTPSARTLAAGLKAMETEPDLNEDQRKLTWYQIDLFHERETDASIASRKSQRRRRVE